MESSNVLDNELACNAMNLGLNLGLAIIIYCLCLAELHIGINICPVVTLFGGHSLLSKLLLVKYVLNFLKRF